MEWLDPWGGVAEFGPDIKGVVERVLGQELSPGHVLYGIPVEAIAKRDGTDDVLFQLIDGSGRVAEVHLTWTQRPPESPPWPHTAVYPDLQTWADEVMRPDHDEQHA